MQFYPYYAPIILTDAIFLTYGGQTGTSTQAMRDASYLMAEDQMTEYLHSFLLPTIITGTHFWKGGNPVELDYGNLNQVYRVTVSSIDWSNSCEIDTITGCYAIRGDGHLGLLDINYLLSCAGCGQVVTNPYNIIVAYNSGLPSGTSYQPKMLQALTLAAQVNLNEMDVSLANETTADIGIEFFINQSYHEKRMKTFDTVFGNSAVSMRIARLVRKYRARSAIGFH